MILNFDEDSHTYTLGGKVIPSVTQVLSPLTEYAGIPKHILDAAADRGNYVHKACEMYLWETLDEDSLKEEARPYFNGFKKFMSETGFIPEVIEERVYHPTLKYAGTLDLGGILPPAGRRKKPQRALIDLKTTFKLMRAVGPQTAAYFDAWAAANPKDKFEARYALQLKKDGTYCLEPMKDRTDSNIFLSCLNIFNFMKGN